MGMIEVQESHVRHIDKALDAYLKIIDSLNLVVGTLCRPTITHIQPDINREDFKENMKGLDE